MSSLHGRRFTVASGGVDVGSSTVFLFTEDRLTGVVTATYRGGAVLAGSLVGTRDGSRVEFRYSHVTRAGGLESGISRDSLSVLPDGRLRLDEQWEWTSRSGSGTSVLEELPGPRYVRTRLARPVRSLEASAAFYGGVLGLPVDDGLEDGVFVDLPFGGSLELRVGPVVPTPDLLVLYLGSTAEAQALAAGLTPVEVDDPYWRDYGVTVLDPDGYRVVLTAPPGA